MVNGEILVIGHEQIGVMMKDFDCFELFFWLKLEKIIIITLMIFFLGFSD